MSEFTQSSSAVSAAAKKFEPDWKRFRPGDHLPVVTLSGDGTIQQVSPAARRMLEYGHNKDLAPCFFSHVHARNMYQVMRDVADMVCYGKPKASWLVRIRTGSGRWQWVRASVTNQLNGPERAIRVVLESL